MEQECRVYCCQRKLPKEITTQLRISEGISSELGKGHNWKSWSLLGSWLKHTFEKIFLSKCATYLSRWEWCHFSERCFPFYIHVIQRVKTRVQESHSATCSARGFRCVVHAGQCFKRHVKKKFLKVPLACLVETVLFQWKDALITQEWCREFFKDTHRKETGKVYFEANMGA